jgi:pyruvate formate lyase activating enzyme
VDASCLTHLPIADEDHHDGRVGYLHSELTGSALDGPGLRTVFWLSGCALRCSYCHNPDTWSLHAGRRVALDDVVREVEKYARIAKATGGGITLSGGEPLVQAKFCRNVLRAARALGVHTALDTNGFLGHRLSDQDLADVDLVLLDLKSADPVAHRRATGRDRGPIFDFARRLSRLGRPLWVRFVLVPGLTDAPQNIAELARFCATLTSLERVEVLPFHQLGRYKWRALGRAYALETTPPPSPGMLEAARDTFRAAGLKCPG